jgi:hypothetical protein
MPRDNFNKPTLDALAKRVAFFCSNPECGRPTVGPNSQPDGVLSIGVGAHITAAASGGPRYDTTLTPAQRSSIGNGIWLCASCSVMIDKDEVGFPTPMLNQWKGQAEEKARASFKSGRIATSPRPAIYLDLIWALGGRMNRGLSPKNPIVTIDGQSYYESGPKPIIFWELDWVYKVVLYNNSSASAFDLSIASVGSNHFSEISSLPRINNLPALANLDIDATLRDMIESDHEQADKLVLQKLPSYLNDLVLEISYRGEDHQKYKTKVSFNNGEINNEIG